MTARNSVLSCLLFASLASGPAYAQTAAAPTANDAGPIGSAKISLDAAVAAAEKHVQGKASRAEYEKQKGGQWVYDVEVVAGAKTFDVKVNAENGAVIASAEDKTDTDDRDDEAD